MRNTVVASIFIIFFVTSGLSQDKIALLDFQNAGSYLELSEKQIEVISPLVEQIRRILDEDRIKIESIKKRIKEDDEPGFFEKISIKRGHDNRASHVEDLVEEIEDKLTDPQKIKFKNLSLPELKSLKKEDVFGK